MRVQCAQASSWTGFGRDVDPLSLPETEILGVIAATIERPEAIAAGNWRRMSRLAKLFAMAVEPLMARIEPATDQLALFTGSMNGEFGTGIAFQRSFVRKGVESASPLLFQNSVHNVAAAHLGIALGLHGSSEALSAGPVTLIRTIERAMAWVLLRKLPALVVVGEEFGEDTQQGLQLAQIQGKFVEGAAAFWLEPGEGFRWEEKPGMGWWRSAGWPGESEQVTTGPSYDQRLGASVAADGAVLAAVARLGGRWNQDGCSIVVEQSA